MNRKDLKFKTVLFFLFLCAELLAILSHPELWPIWMIFTVMGSAAFLFSLR